MKSLHLSKAIRARYFAILAGFLVSLLTGCATVEGLGQDIQSAGEELEEASEDAQN